LLVRTTYSTDKLTEFSDEALVQKILATGNTAYFGVIYDRYAQLVYQKCYGFTKSVSEAQDLTQDIFLKLFLSLKTFKGKSKFSTWLYALTYNYCINYVTRDKNKQIEKEKVPVEEAEQLMVEIDDAVFYNFSVNKLEQALDLIAPEDKLILLLKYQDELPIKEIMEILKIGESAAKMRIKRAKARLVKVYNDIV
jgi:RNA polymerase sigma-70 factor (ECF subfamily)